jgi:hypothetical protein
MTFTSLPTHALTGAALRQSTLTANGPGPTFGNLARGLCVLLVTVPSSDSRTWPQIPGNGWMVSRWPWPW